MHHPPVLIWLIAREQSGQVIDVAGVSKIIEQTDDPKEDILPGGWWSMCDVLLTGGGGVFQEEIVAFRVIVVYYGFHCGGQDAAVKRYSAIGRWPPEVCLEGHHRQLKWQAGFG